MKTKGRTNVVNARAIRACLECTITPLRDFVRELVSDVIAEHDDGVHHRGMIRKAAADLGVGRRTIERILEEGQLGKKG